MAQIQSPETYIDGQQVTAARLNNQTNGSILLPGAVTDQTAIAAGTVASGDTVIIHDTSASALRKATVGDLLGSGVSASFSSATVDTLTTSVINGKANADINATPNDGVLVTSKTFSSVDGITAVVSSTAHGLENNTCLDITASNPVYSGQYFINVISVDSFSYTIRQATPVAASGTIDYTKKGTVKAIGSQHIAGNLEVALKTELRGATAVSGSFVSTGSSTFSGTSNFTGALQVNGAAAYVLTDVIEENVPNFVGTAGNTTHSMFTSSSYTKPAGELWIVEAVGDFALLNNSAVTWRITNSDDTIIYTSSYLNNDTAEVWPFYERFYLPSANEHTGTFVLRGKTYGGVTANFTLSPTEAQLNSTLSLPNSTVLETDKRIDGKFRIFKYKTA